MINGSDAKGVMAFGSLDVDWHKSRYNRGQVTPNPSRGVLYGKAGSTALTKDELYQLLGHQDIERDLDVKTLVLDLLRERMTPAEIQEIFWQQLGGLDEAFIRGYFYRRFS